jgi:hypothetical protein
MPDQKPLYEKWLWIELIGFDNESRDFGVKAYLDHTGFLPDAVSLLLYNPDFVHAHEGMDQDRTFPIDFSSYAAHPSSYERTRQDWTKFQLRGLVQELQKYGSAVYFSIFDLFVTREWIGHHPELLHVTSRGERISSVCPWKRFRDGRSYEDFFVAQLGRVLHDYGFDGFHQADGYSHPRLPLYEGDYSDDLIEQFVRATGVPLPDGLGDPAGDEAEVLQRRREWIWRHARREWIEFYARRVQAFCRKVADAVHAQGKQVVLNNALTRDPFQALYRYGVDYRRLAEAGVDGFMVETVAPGVTLGAESGMEANPHYDYQAMLLLVKASVPHLMLRCLNGVHDVNEQWDVLRHGPTLLEREIYGQANLYVWNPEGQPERCSRGPLVCLADGLQRHEWQWLKQWWDLAFSVTPRRIVGATLVWSDHTLERQLEEFIPTRRWTIHKLLYELMSRGAPIYSAVNVRDVAKVQGPLLVLNPQLLSADELQNVRSYPNGPVVLIGGRPHYLPQPDWEFEDVYPPYPLFCGVYGAPGREVTLEPGDPEKLSEDLLGIAEPPTFVQELYFRRVSDSFLTECVRLLADCAGTVKVLRRADVIRVQALELEDRQLRLFVGNDSHYYVITELDVGREIERIRVATAFPGTPPGFRESVFSVRVPGKGMVVLDVFLKEE